MNYKLSLTFVLVSYHLVLGSEEFTNDEITDNTDDQSLNRVRRGLSMLRLGRGLQMLRLGKRAPLMLRLGRSAGDSMSNDDFQYLLNLLRNDRSVPLPRYGKDLAWQYMLMNALKDAEMNEMYDSEEPDYRFGYELGSPAERQIRPAPRPGRFRRSADNVENQQADDKMVRAVPLPRFGKELPEGEEQKYEIVRLMPITQDSKEADEYDDSDDIDETAVKRAMHMLRLGRGMRMLRLGKRPMDSDEEVSEADKRALRLLRLGKRPFKMLRLGRGGNDEEKRALRLLRLGKKSNSELES